MEQNEWWHVYNRGVAKALVFRSTADRRVFLDCFGRHLGLEPAFDERGRPYRWLRRSVAVGAYCLMPNHFHLIVRAQRAELRKLMQSATIGYGSYFNARYERPGPLWQGRFRANPLPTTQALMQATAYVQLNWENDPSYKWSSHSLIVEGRAPAWLRSDVLLNAFDGFANYESFIEADRLRRERISQHGFRNEWIAIEAEGIPHSEYS